MKEQDRLLVRKFYQSLATSEEKEAFLEIFGKTEKAKMLILGDLAKAYGMNSDLVKIVMNTTALTKEDRIMIASGIVRQWIFKFFTMIGS